MSAVEAAVGISDKYFTVETEQAEYGVAVPEIRVTVSVTLEE